MSSTLDGLIERVKNASGADRELDAAIHHAVTGDEPAMVYPASFAPDEPITMVGFVDGTYVRRYTASVDAALALVERMLPGWWWTIGDCDLTHDATIAPPHASAIGPGHALTAALGPDFRAGAAQAALVDDPIFDRGFDVARTTGNVPLALIEAMLLALSALASRKP